MLALSRLVLPPPAAAPAGRPRGRARAGPLPAATARTYALLADLRTAGTAVVVAEQRVPPGLPRGTLVHELRRGALAFSGEPAELLPPGAPPPRP